MGIPSFYRWLIERYPLAVTDVIEDPPTVVNGVSVPLDCSRPNPNGLEFDNLYLDMNGIIHPCFHPEGLQYHMTYNSTELFMLLCTDGVAPRAKMNQQRTRRFRAAKDAADEVNFRYNTSTYFLPEKLKFDYYQAAKIESERGVQESEGQDLERTKKLDSNVITPGTEFMSLLSSALQYYIHLRMNMDPGWRISRSFFLMPMFLDADLIMLALATHEIHFSILREDVRKAYTKDRWLVGVICHCAIVIRDYLVHDLSIPDPTVMTDLERLIDDFVFMCIFVGNDFLPHIPSLEIFEGAIDLLMAVYKEEFAHMGGYLTNSFEARPIGEDALRGEVPGRSLGDEMPARAWGAHIGRILVRRSSWEVPWKVAQSSEEDVHGLPWEGVNLGRVEHFVKAVSSHENAILRKRSQPGVKKVQSSINHVTDVGNPVIDQVKLGEEGWKERYYAEKFEANTNDDREKIRGHSVLKYIEGICWVMHYYYQGVCSWQWFYPYHYAPFASDFCGLDQLKIHFVLGKPFKPFDQLMGVLPAARCLQCTCTSFLLPEVDDRFSSPILDFYPEDFELDMNGKRFLWQDFAHYALASFDIVFLCMNRLFANCHLLRSPASSWNWKGGAHVDGRGKTKKQLGLDILCIHKSHPLSTKIFPFWERNKDNPKVAKAKVKRKINAEVSGGMNGYIYISDEPVCPSEINPPTDAMVMITDNKVMYVSVDGFICITEIEPSGRSVFYKFPCFHPHIPKPPEGAKMPVKFVRKQDVLPPPVLWHDRRSLRGRIYSERPIPNSISGSRLEKLAHRLVCKYYLAKQPGSQGSMKVGSDIVVDAMVCQPNLKVTVSRKELDAGGNTSLLLNGLKRNGNEAVTHKNLRVLVWMI
ncbi:hypothetical protein C3L33_03442, partial [Rhododendron williamsianum]